MQEPNVGYLERNSVATAQRGQQFRAAGTSEASGDASQLRLSSKGSRHVTFSSPESGNGQRNGEDVASSTDGNDQSARRQGNHVAVRGPPPVSWSAPASYHQQYRERVPHQFQNSMAISEPTTRPRLRGAQSYMTRGATLSSRPPFRTAVPANLNDLGTTELSQCFEEDFRGTRPTQPMRSSSVRGQQPSDESRDSEEQFVDGNYFFNHLMREKAAEDYNMAEMLRERDRDWRKKTQFRGRAAFTTFGKGRGIDRLSTSLPVGSLDSRQQHGPGYYYYQSNDGNIGLPILNGKRTLDARRPTAEGGAGDVPFAGGLEIEIPLRRHGGLGGGGIRTLRESVSADRLLMVPPTHREPFPTFGRSYFRAAESSTNLEPPLPSRNPNSAVIGAGSDNAIDHRPPLRALPNQMQAGVSSANLSKSLRTKDQDPDINKSSLPSQNVPSSNVARHYPKQSPTTEPIFNSYNVRTGRFQPDPEHLLPPPKPNLTALDQSSPFRTKYNQSEPNNLVPKYPHAGYVNQGVDVTSENLIVQPTHRSFVKPTEGHVGDNSNSATQQRQNCFVPHPTRGVHKFASASNVGYSVMAGQPHAPFQDVGAWAVDPRLSVSFDPAAMRRGGHKSHPQLIRNHQSAESQAQLLCRYQEDLKYGGGNPHDSRNHSNDAINRKVVTWEDQAVLQRSNNTSGPKPFHDNPVFASEIAENDNNNNNNNSAASSNDNTGSFSREGLSYPINLSLSRSLLIGDLENVDQFALFEVSTSKLCWAENFTGADWLDKIKQYKFVVLNRQEEVLFIGTEEEGAISNCIISPHKSSFKVRILDANGQDVIHFRRLYPVKTKANFSYGQKNKYRLEVVTPSGHVIGNVEKTYDSDTYYILEDRAGECLFLVQRSCICTCPLFWDYEFKILLPDNDEEVGEISWSYLTAQNEQFNGTEISFPIDLNTTSKIMLLGVCFLLNFSRWQSSYLDSLYNPGRRRGKPNDSRPTKEANREIDSLLETSPDESGFGDRDIDGPVTAVRHVSGSGSK